MIAEAHWLKVGRIRNIRVIPRYLRVKLRMNFCEDSWALKIVRAFGKGNLSIDFVL